MIDYVIPNSDSRQCPNCGHRLPSALPDSCPGCGTSYTDGVDRPRLLRTLSSALLWVRRAESLWLALVFLLAVGHLFLLHGADPGIILMFLLPPAIAVWTATHPGATRAARLLAWTFLVLIATGVFLGPQHKILPGMDAWKGQLPITQSRILTWYSGVYLLYLGGILPPFAFLTSLWRHRHGVKAQLSPPTCYLGLFTWSLMMLAVVPLGVPRVIAWALGR